jgi:hypothetical protein
MAEHNQSPERRQGRTGFKIERSPPLAGESHDAVQMRKIISKKGKIESIFLYTSMSYDVFLK